MIKLNIKNHKEMYIKLLAAATALVMFICFSMVCWLTPQKKLVAHADDAAVAQLAQNVFSTTVALANTVQNPTAEGVAILAAQAALSYMYFSNNGSPPSAGANGDGAKYYAGYTTFTDGHLYFGAGSINANSTLTSVSISSSTADNTISAYRYLADSGSIGSCRTVSATAVGLGAPSGHGEAYVIATSGAGSQNHLSGVFNGDPMTGALSIGVVDALSRATTSYNTQNSTARFLFWSGSADVTSIVPPSGDSFVEQFDALQEELKEDYPDVDEDYYIYIDNPSDPSETGGCHCNVTVVVEPTIIVEPTINVYVSENVVITNNIDVDLELPSDWLTDVTEPTNNLIDDTINYSYFSEEPTFPELDSDELEEYREQFGDGIQFWFALAYSFIETMHLEVLISFAFLLAVIGFVLWRTGGGGKSD